MKTPSAICRTRARGPRSTMRSAASARQQPQRQQRPRQPGRRTPDRDEGNRAGRPCRAPNRAPRRHRAPHRSRPGPACRIQPATTSGQRSGGTYATSPPAACPSGTRRTWCTRSHPPRKVAYSSNCTMTIATIRCAVTIHAASRERRRGRRASLRNPPAGTRRSSSTGCAARGDDGATRRSPSRESGSRP